MQKDFKKKEIRRSLLPIPSSGHLLIREKMAKFEVELTSQQVVKPSSPTPSHRRHHQLSSLDQIMVPIYQRYLFFYPGNNTSDSIEKCQRLKQSLSETLTLFYPLAGRLKDNMYVDCNDEGVQFVEAKAKCTILDFLEKGRNCNEINKLLPIPVRNATTHVQATSFDCGGMVIGFAMLHKVGDGISAFMFLNAWTAIARGQKSTTVPRFDLARHFPPIRLSGFDPCFEVVPDNIVAKWFVFDESKIAMLRDSYANPNSSIQSSKRPTRVEALTAFIWSKFMATTQAKADGHSKTYVVHHPVNLRPRMDLPISESRQYFGNLIVEPVVAMPDLNAKDGCYGIVSQMRQTIRNVDAEYVKKLQQGEAHLNMMKERAEGFADREVVGLNFSSLCGFPVYEIDFGWGKPLWVGLAPMPLSNLIFFFDTKAGGGIEIYVHLKEEDMEKFENDVEIARVVSPSPRRMKLSAL